MCSFLEGVEIFGVEFEKMGGVGIVCFFLEDNGYVSSFLSINSFSSSFEFVCGIL